MEFVRRALLIILAVGLTGTLVELFLLKHTEGFWQGVPVVLTAVALLVVIWCGARPGRASLRTLQLLMALFIISGGVGTIQHFRGNVISESESNPSLGGAELYRVATMGATPVLAPGIMLQFGLIGLLFAYRHPALDPTGRDLTSDRKES
jgi:hypothetical protein